MRVSRGASAVHRLASEGHDSKAHRALGHEGEQSLQRRPEGSPRNELKGVSEVDADELVSVARVLSLPRVFASLRGCRVLCTGA